MSEPPPPSAAAPAPAAGACDDVVSSDSDPFGIELFRWLSPFGLTTQSTGLSLFTGSGPEERGLRLNTHMHRRTKKNQHDDEDENEPKDESPCPCCASTSASSSSESVSGVSTASACACFPSPPTVAPILSIPTALLITPAKVRASGFIKTNMKVGDIERATDIELLSLFLIHQHRLGPRSKWSPYITSLPRSYTCIEWWSHEELQSTPCLLEERARLRRNEVKREFRRISAWIEGRQPTNVTSEEEYDDDDHPSDEDSFLPLSWKDSLSPHTCSTEQPCSTTSLCSPLTLSEWQWASATVGTRSCFLPPVGYGAIETGANRNNANVGSTSSSSATRLSHSSSRTGVLRDSTCLVPFLDMLNHSSNVRVDCRLTTHGYELWMLEPSNLRLHMGEELFINYGPYSNDVLLERYGFTMLKNRHEMIQIKLKHLEDFLTTRQELLDEEEYRRRNRIWHESNTSSSSSSSSSHLPNSFYTCSCSQSHSLTSLKLPRYARPFPGFSKYLSVWQSELLKACGLYEICSEIEKINLATSSISSTASSKSITFDLRPCHVPFDLMTYIRIKILTIEDIRTYVKGQQGRGGGGSTMMSTNVRSSNGVSSNNNTGFSPHDLQILSTRLLNEDSPYLSEGHRLLTQRIVIEWIQSIMFQSNMFRTSSSSTTSSPTSSSSTTTTTIQMDLDEWHNHSHELSYVQQQSLILKLTQKRVCHTILAHAIADGSKKE